MKRYRSQGDEDFNDRSLMGAVMCNAKEDRCRQEEVADTDINKILRHFGLGAPMRPGAQFGEVDYDLDLQTALEAISEAKRAYRLLPDQLRREYPNVISLLAAMERGEVAFTQVDPDAAPPAPPKPGEAGSGGNPA